jgi:hypothetical protein
VHGFSVGGTLCVLRKARRWATAMLRGQRTRSWSSDPDPSICVDTGGDLPSSTDAYPLSSSTSRSVTVVLRSSRQQMHARTLLGKHEHGSDPPWASFAFSSSGSARTEDSFDMAMRDSVSGV